MLYLRVFSICNGYPDENMSALIGGKIESEILLELYDFWEKNCGTSKLMAAADIDPSKITNCLPYIIILDVVGDPRRFRFRLAGTAVDGMNGQYRTGKYLDEIDLGSVTAKTIAMMHDVVDRREPSFFHGEFVGGDTRTLEYERVAMPLSSDGRTVDSILVGLQYVLKIESDQSLNIENFPRKGLG